ncbi:hypothetical protein [Pigmentiphaga sp. CHJ604]|uniref:hypothetical protein n=1 Tax=Pigmentiphaga sp. CHJ604 TaxID=3081984 RepID=UPI0030D1F9B4
MSNLPPFRKRRTEPVLNAPRTEPVLRPSPITPSAPDPAVAPPVLPPRPLSSPPGQAAPTRPEPTIAREPAVHVIDDAVPVLTQIVATPALGEAVASLEEKSTAPQAPEPGFDAELINDISLRVMDKLAPLLPEIVAEAVHEAVSTRPQR